EDRKPVHIVEYATGLLWASWMHQGLVLCLSFRKQIRFQNAVNIIIRTGNRVPKVFFNHQTGNGACPGRSVARVLHHHGNGDLGILPGSEGRENGMIFSMWIL